MGNTGLTGVHSWPMHRSWVEFTFTPMPLSGLPPAFEGLKIVQISDLHLSPLVWEAYLHQYIDWINELKPAVLVATGDLFMGGRRYARRVAELLARAHTTHGTLCIMGNHDYGLDGKALASRGERRATSLERAVEDEGLIMLRNESWRMIDSKNHKHVTFVGLDDDWAGRIEPEVGFTGVPRTEPVVCLVHNPANALRLMNYPWQWMLTGHTHGRQLAASSLGQRLYPGKYRQFTHGLYTINGRNLYVNRGLSYGQRHQEWCRPEVSVFEMTAAPAKSPATLTPRKTSA